MIIAPIPGPSREAALSQVESARRAGADAVELRLDLHDDPDPAPFLSSKSLPVVVTVRPAWEGGRWSRSEDDRIALLRDAARGGADWVDVEFKAYKDFDRGAARLIVSWHEPAGMPARPAEALRKVEALGPDLAKLAFLARGTEDVLACRELQRSATGAAAVVPMGDWGEPLRLLYRRYGAFATWAAVSPELATAPGQPTLEQLVKEYRAKAVDEETKVYAVIGDPVAHSQSPRLFNRIFQELGINARYVKVRLDDAARLRRTVEGLSLSGMSVTIPHKEAAVAQLDAPDEVVKEIGAVNAVVAREGRLEGHNTDVQGAMEALRAAATRKWSHGVYGMRALVLGAGGVARAIAWGLKGDGARVTVANRNFDRAKALGESLGVDYLPWERRTEARPQVLANGTSVGMGADESPYPAEFLKRDQVVLDAVYTPRNTRLVREARAAGAEVADGVEMFLKQAVHQFRHYAGRGIPTELLKEFARIL